MARRQKLLVSDPLYVEATSLRGNFLRSRTLSRKRPTLPDLFGEKPVFWFTFHILHDEERHFGFISSETLRLLNAPDPAPWAMTLFDPNWVLFDKELPSRPALLQRFFLHEIDHLAFADSFVTKKLFGGLSEAAANEREEAFCESHSRMLAAPLFKVGILRMPPLPKKFRSKEASR